MRIKRNVNVLDIEGQDVDRSWIGKISVLDQPKHDELFFLLDQEGQCMSMRAAKVETDGKILRVTTFQDETFVFETIEDNDYHLLANGRVGEWYTEVEEHIVSGKKTLLIRHPQFKDDVSIRIEGKDLQQFIESLQQTQQNLEEV